MRVRSERREREDNMTFESVSVAIISNPVILSQLYRPTTLRNIFETQTRQFLPTITDEVLYTI